MFSPNYINYWLRGAFLYYNLELFGEKLKQIRKALSIGQKEIHQITGIEERTIRRIENAKVLPKLDTLEILSLIYKEDLVSLLIQCRLDDYSTFSKIKNEIEFKIDNEEQYNLHIEVRMLTKLLSSVENLYYKNLISQLILFAEAAILYKDNKNNNNIVALNKFVEAIKITNSAFSLDNYDSFVYSSIEIRILMNIAFVINKLNDKEKYLEIIEFCVNSVDTDDEIYPKLCHNLAGAYRRNKNYTKSLEFSKLGIKTCQENRLYNGLSLLYYGRGLSEHYLGESESIDSLSLSVSLCEAFGQDKLKKTIIDNCNKILGIDLKD